MASDEQEIREPMPLDYAVAILQEEVRGLKDKFHSIEKKLIFAAGVIVALQFVIPYLLK